LWHEFREEKQLSAFFMGLPGKRGGMFKVGTDISIKAGDLGGSEDELFHGRVLWRVLMDKKISSLPGAGLPLPVPGVKEEKKNHNS